MANKTGYQLERTFNRPLERYRTVTSITDRDAIPNGIRYKGMMCYVDGENKDYQLLGGVTNEDWTSVSADGLFNKDFDTTDDIVEGGNNKFMLQAERAKLDNVEFDDLKSSQKIGFNSGLNNEGVRITATGTSAASGSVGDDITATGFSAASGSVGNRITATGFIAGIRTNGNDVTVTGYNAARNANGNNITAIGANAGVFQGPNTLQTPNATALGANTVIDKANQIVIGDADVTEVKIGETLVIDKDQIVNGAEGLLVTKKVGGKTVTEVSNELQNQVNSIQFEGVKTYQNLSELPDPLNLPNGLAVKIANDTTIENNGYYSIVSGAWVKDYDLYENISERLNVSLIPSGSATNQPILNISTKVLDLGEDPILLIGKKHHTLRSIHGVGADEYRNIDLTIPSSSAGKLIFNTTTFLFSVLTYNVELTDEQVLIGGIRDIGGLFKYNLPFKVTELPIIDDFETDIYQNTNVSLIADINGALPQVKGDLLDLGNDPILLIGDERYALKIIHPSNPEK